MVTRTGPSLIPSAHAIVRYNSVIESGDVLFAREYPEDARSLTPFPFAFFATDTFMIFQVRDPDAQMRIYVAGPNAERPTEMELPRGAYGELHASGHRAVLTVSSDLFLYDHREGRARALTPEDSITERSAFLHGDTLAFIQGRSPTFGAVESAQVAVMDLRTGARRVLTNVPRHPSGWEVTNVSTNGTWVVWSQIGGEARLPPPDNRVIFNYREMWGFHLPTSRLVPIATGEILADTPYMSETELVYSCHIRELDSPILKSSGMYLLSLDALLSPTWSDAGAG